MGVPANLARRTVVCGVGALLTIATTANATPITFAGADAPVTNISAPLPNTNLARAQFNAAVAALAETTTLDDLESLALLSPGNGVHVDLGKGIGVTLQNTASGDLSNSFGTGVRSEANPTTAANPGFGFNTTPGGMQFFRIITQAVNPGVTTQALATFDFATPVNAFGLTLTGLGTNDGGIARLQFQDGTTQTLTVPGSGIALSGGSQSSAEFFGFVDDGALISSIQFQLLYMNPLPPGNGQMDYLVGFDDVTAAAPIPEPASCVLLATGAALLRRHFRRSS